MIRYSKATKEYLNDQNNQRKEERNLAIQRVVRKEFRRVAAVTNSIL